MSTYGRDSYDPGKHVPKVVRCNAGRDEPALYKNLGNSQRIKFMWVESVTIVSGTTYLVYDAGDFGAGKEVNKPDHYAPGGGAYGKTIADLHFWPVAYGAPVGSLWIDVDTVADTVTLTSTGTEVDLDVDILVFSS
jgi:hypothetical protein